MPNRKTPDDYRKLATNRGFNWLGPEVSNTVTKTRWQCDQGHKWYSIYSNIRKGSGCPYCAKKAPKRSADYHLLAKKRKFKWLGSTIKTVMDKTLWECEHKHRWESRYNDIQQGLGCPYCSNRARKIPRDYFALAHDKGYSWLGPEADNTHAKTTWQCAKGHRWESRYHDIQRGYGCPFCANSIPKTREDYYELAHERGCTWIGPKVKTTHVKTEWECSKKHRWYATYHSVLSEKGCPTCAIDRRASKRRHDPAEYHKLAEERGIHWLGPEVRNTGEKTRWECSEGHQWFTRYNDILKGGGCPTCIDMVNSARVSKPQRELCEMLSGKLNLPMGPYNIDIAISIDGIPIAIEYDSWYWHSGREARENERDQYLISKGWRVLRVKSNTLLPTEKQLSRAISYLLAGNDYFEIMLRDWSIGPTKLQDHLP